MKPLIDNAIAFLVMNIALMLASQGTIGWGAHVGGFTAGVLVSLMA